MKIYLYVNTIMTTDSHLKGLISIKYYNASFQEAIEISVPLGDG